MGKADTKKRPASSATRAESIRAFQAARTPEERAESARKAQAARTLEQRAAIAAKAAATRAKNAAEKKRRQEAAQRALETKRARYPERFKAQPEPEKKPKKTERPKDPRRVAAGRKGAETRRRNEAARRAAAESMRAGIEARKREAAADWRSELTYVSGAGAGTLQEWVRELFAALVEDTAGIYRPDADSRKIPPGLLDIPWRVQGGVQGTSGGSAVFDIVVTGTAHERAVALIQAVVAAGEAGGLLAKDRYRIRGPMNGRGPRAARPVDAAAERAREEALAKYATEGEKAQPMRIDTLVAPADSPT